MTKTHEKLGKQLTLSNGTVYTVHCKSKVIVKNLLIKNYKVTGYSF